MRIHTLRAVILAAAICGQASAETLKVEVANIEILGDPKTGEPIVSLTLTPESRLAIGEFTKARIGEQVKMRLGDTVLSEPFVLEPITQGRLAISGGMTQAHARAIADLILKSGNSFEVDGSDK